MLLSALELQKKSKNFSIICAWMTALVGLFFTGAWVSGLSFLPDDVFLLSFSNSLTLFFFGLCFLSLIYLKRSSLYKILATILFLYTLSILFQSHLPTYLRASSLLSKDLLLQNQSETISLLISSLLFLLWPVRNRTTVKSAIISLGLFFVFFIALAGIITSIFSINPKDLVIGTSISPPFDILQLFLAVGLFLLNRHQDFSNKSESIGLLPIIFAEGILLFHFFLITGLMHQQRIVIEDSLKAKNLSIQTFIQEYLYNLGNDLNQISSRIELSHTFKNSFLKIDAQNLLSTDQALNKVSWFDKDFYTIDSIPQEEAIPSSVLKKILKSPPQNTSLIYYLNSLDRKIYIISKIMWDDSFQGGVCFQIDPEKLIQKIQSYETLHAYNLSLRSDSLDVPIYQNFTDPKTNVFTYTSNFKTYDIPLTLSISVTKKNFITKITSQLSLYITFAGFIGALLTGFLVYLLKTLKKKNSTYQKIEKKLEISNQLMKVMNEAETISDACDKILSILYDHDDWSLFIFWQKNAPKKELTQARITSIPFGSFSTFERAIKALPSHGNTQFLEAFNKKETVYCEDYSQSEYTLAKEAEHSGLKGAIAIPVFQKREVLGVMQLFRKEPLTEDSLIEYQDWIENIGNEFSFFIERREAHIIDKELTSIILRSKDAIYKVDLDLKICSWNLGGEIIYGWKEEEIIGLDLSSLYPRELKHEMIHIKQKMLNYEGIEHIITRSKKRDGTIIWVENSYSPIVNENGQVLSFSVISKDISKEKEFVDALKINEEKFRLFVESTKSWIWEMDSAGLLTFCNPAVVRILGYDSKDLIGRCWLSLCNDKEKMQKEWLLNLEKQSGWKQRLWQAKAQNGSLIWLEGTADPIFDKDGHLTGFRGVDRDVTEEVRINEGKNEFISMVSHELRTPLTSIIGAVKLIKANSQLPKDLKELIELADRNSERLLKLINDILDLEKLILGKIQLNLKPYDLTLIVKEAIKTATPQAKERNITLIENNGHSNIFVLVDQDRLLQVILNLLSNAIKFSFQDSSVVISIELMDTIARIKVKDQGKGIAYELQDKIFEKFVQGESGDTKVKGTGLGLNISKSIIEQMGGKISFTSQPGHGALFYIDLPMHQKVE
jgi:PAS domain S-box-containing protein